MRYAALPPNGKANPIFVALLVVVALLLVGLLSQGGNDSASAKRPPQTASYDDSVLGKFRNLQSATADSGTLARVADSIVKVIPLSRIRSTPAGELLRAVYAVESAPTNAARSQWLTKARPEADRQASADAAKAGANRKSSESVVDSRISSADRVMSNARALCRIYEEAPHLVVECDSNLPRAQQLEFATAIANADAVLTGRARNIYFYVGGEQFAQADPIDGVRLK
jgi:hypothetical protein